jgi:heat-inducible transcriptional repressor
VLEDRRLAVLRAIVEDYVSTREPVGSKALVERHNLGVSPATIRNDMAVLEEEGYIAQPHTSAGRIPTEAGYRVFVDRLSSVKPLSGPERRAISDFLAGAVDLDDVMTRSVRLLAQLTRQVALVQYPSLSQARVRHVEIVRLSDTRLLLILISDTGRVEQRTADLPGALSDDDVNALRTRLLTVLIGERCTQIAAVAAELPDLPGALRPALAAVVAALSDMTVERAEERVVIGGTANLARYGENFLVAVEPILEALEEQVVLLRLFGEVADNGGIVVRIGHENPVQDLQSTSFVGSGYGRDETVARLGVLGPTHMDYSGTMGAVHAVAQYLGRILKEQ